MPSADHLDPDEKEPPLLSSAYKKINCLRRKLVENKSGAVFIQCKEMRRLRISALVHLPVI